MSGDVPPANHSEADHHDASAQSEPAKPDVADQTVVVSDEQLQAKAHIQFAREAQRAPDLVGDPLVDDPLAQTLDFTEAGATGGEERPVPTLPGYGAKPLYIPLLDEADHGGRAEVSSARYIKTGKLGEGGMGEVLCVQDRLLKREVALKRVRESAPPRVREAFIREARILAQLNHPSIISIHDLMIPESSVPKEGQTCFTMEKVEGETLTAQIKRLCDSEPQVASDVLYELLNILINVGEAIEYAHERGVIHRDLKPDNIMIGAHGEVRVLDWGLGGELSREGDKEDASETRSKSSLTVSFGLLGTDNPSFTFTGTVSGTPAYMSPEQARGEQVTAQTDVYALGAILYEILSGVAPYVKELRSHPNCALLILDRVKEARQPPNLRRRDCPHPHIVTPYLLKVCAHALHPDPERRYTSVGAFISELKEYLSGGSRRSQVEETKARARHLYRKTNEHMATHPLASTLWERLDVVQSVPLVAHFRSQVLHYLEELVRWDRSDIEARLWGIQLRYHFIHFLWWRGELDTAYQITSEVLSDRCAHLEDFKESALGARVPWREVEVLKRQRRQVELTIVGSAGSAISYALTPVTRLDKEAFGTDYRQSKDSSRERSAPHAQQGHIEGDQLSLQLAWGQYSLELAWSSGEGQMRITQLLQVTPQPLPCFEERELLPLADYLSLEESWDPHRSTLRVQVSLPVSDAQVRQLRLGLPDASPLPSFEWIGTHRFYAGTWLPLKDTASSREVECGGLWMQRSPITISTYLHYINKLDQLARSLPDEERAQASQDLERVLPVVHYEVEGQALYTRKEPSAPYSLSEEALLLGLTEDSPAMLVSYLDIERYLLFLSWETGVPWSIPSELEWELGARVLDQRLFPWGDRSPEGLAMMGGVEVPSTRDELASRGAPLSGLSEELRRAQYPHDLSPFLIEGMGGGVSEWTTREEDKERRRQLMRSWCAQRPCDDAPLEERARRFFNAGEWRETFEVRLLMSEMSERNEQVVRGGSYLRAVEECSAVHRRELGAHKRRVDLGFRLVLCPQ